MKKSILLNSEISYEVAKIGHKQIITIADAGLPIPQSVKRIDLAVAKQIPSLLQVLDALLTEMQVEKIILPEEIIDIAPELKDQILERFQGNEVELEYVKHEQFKILTEKSQSIIRTGETTPYANIILTSGVTF